jgi:hypothetical protein
MGLLNSIAAFGISGRGYDEMDQRYRQRDRELQAAKVNDIAVKEAMRKDDLGESVRAAVQGVSPRAAVMGLNIPEHQGEAYDEEYRPATKEGFDVPASTDVRGKLKAAADVYLERGEIEQAEKLRKSLDALESEGYKHLVTGVAAGKDPREIAAQFNRIGEKRIVDGSTDGRTYKFKYEDGSTNEFSRDQARGLASALGYMKKPDVQQVHKDSNLVNTDTGEVIARGPTSPPPVRNIDPLSPEGLAAKKDFETWKSTLGGKGPGAPAKIREINSLMSEFDMDREKAIELAYGINRNSKSYEDRVRAWATVLKSDMDLGMDSTKLLEAAKRLTSAFDEGGAPKPRPALSAAPKVATSRSTSPAEPEQLGGPGSPGFDARVPLTLKAPGGRDATFTGRYTKAGKPIYSDGTNRFVAE